MVMTPEMIARMQARQDAISKQFDDARKYGTTRDDAEKAARVLAREQRRSTPFPKTSLEQRQAMKEDVSGRVAQLEKIGQAPRQLEKQLMKTAQKEVFQPLQQKIKAFQDPRTGDLSREIEKSQKGAEREYNLLRDQLDDQREYFKDLGRYGKSNMIQGMRREVGLNAPNYMSAPRVGKDFVPGKLSSNPFDTKPGGLKKGGKVKKYKSGGAVSSASKRADGCATKGKTKGRIV